MTVPQGSALGPLLSLCLYAAFGPNSTEQQYYHSDAADADISGSHQMTTAQ